LRACGRKNSFLDVIDLERMAIPQADEQMRLFSQLITDMVAAGCRCLVCGLAQRQPALLVITGDSHANPVANIEALLPLVEAHNGVD